MKYIDFSEIRALLDQMHVCRSCPKMIPNEVPRSIIDNWDFDLFLMAQAPSEHGVRVSGVHWIGGRGKLRRPGGTYLDRYLRTIGFSIDPDESILPRPYTTNAAQCWPGRGGSRDRPPSANELRNCSEWWQKELRLLQPKAVLLLGKHAADGIIKATGLSITFEQLLEEQGKELSIRSFSTAVYTVPHPVAPYRGSRGGRDAYYNLAFSELKIRLEKAKVSMETDEVNKRRNRNKVIADRLRAPSWRETLEAIRGCRTEEEARQLMEEELNGLNRMAWKKAILGRMRKLRRHEEEEKYGIS